MTFSEVDSCSEISIHALREEGDGVTFSEVDSCSEISIHALREEGDRTTLKGGEKMQISIHALREEGDIQRRHGQALTCDFYPRPPRGGRPLSRRTRPPTCYFYPRPPRGGRPRRWRRNGEKSDFYPRPPRGGRLTRKQGTLCISTFLSTPSARRATGHLSSPNSNRHISIHALREEGD